MSWRRTLAFSAGRAVARSVGHAVSPSPTEVARRMQVDEHWRRHEDGAAARLGPRQTIDVANPVGQWRRVDPRVPHDGWGAVGKVAGLGMWAGAIGVAWWLGSSRGRGPLSAVAELDRFGEALGFGDPGE